MIVTQGYGNGMITTQGYGGLGWFLVSTISLIKVYSEIVERGKFFSEIIETW